MGQVLCLFLRLWQKLFWPEVFPRSELSRFRNCLVQWGFPPCKQCLRVTWCKWRVWVQSELGVSSEKNWCALRDVQNRIESLPSATVSVHQQGSLLCSLPFHPYLAPISSLSIFTIPGNWTPNLTTLLITTDHYTSYSKYHPWSRPMHSLMAVCLLFTSCPP